MKLFSVFALLLVATAIAFASEIDVDISARVAINSNVSVVNRRAWTVLQGVGFVVGSGASVSVAPGFAEIDAMFAGLTLDQQCSIGLAWYKRSVDLNLNLLNANSITFQSAAAAFGFFSRFWGIVEYLDTNGQPGFQPGDTILSFYSLSRNLLFNNIWKPFRLDTVSLNGEVCYVVTVQTTDEVFGLQMFLAPRPIVVDNVTIDQDAVKLAIEINYYNYSGASTNPNAKIALVVLVGAAAAVSFKTETVATVDVPSTDAMYRGFQQWDLSFQLSNRDGSNTRRGSVQSFWEEVFSNVTQIQGQFQAEWKVSAAYFSFGVDETRPEHIWWDPQMGASVNYNSNTTPSASNSFQLGPSVFVVLVALFAVLINQLTEV